MTKGTINNQTVAMIGGAAFITYESYCKHRSEYSRKDQRILDNIFKELDNELF